MKYLKIFILLFAFSCAPSNLSQDCLNKKSYKNEWHNFQVCYPSNWTSKNVPDFNNVMLIGNQIDSSNLKVNGVFGIRVYKLPEEENSYSAYLTNINNLKSDSTFKAFNIESEKKINLDGFETIKTIYKTTVGSLNTTTLQYYLSFDDKLIIMGGTLPTDSLRKFETIYSSIAESIKFN